jgi:KUP system potassium uptake protein
MSVQNTSASRTGEEPSASQNNHHQGQFKTLLLGCIGVVYGDIGTSPLYAFREAAHHIGGKGVTNEEILGILSLILWALMITVTIKYVMFLLRVDNKGEGGILALMALTQRKIKNRNTGFIFFAGITGAALFFADGAITPAISVLSAVEGTKLITPAFESFVLPLAVVIIIALFSMQRHGTGKVSRLFGPITLVWFVALGVGGMMWIIKQPVVLNAINPYYALHFVFSHGFLSFVVLGSVFLAVTGAEALYSDLGHFGRKPIQVAWLYLVFPCLALNYLGQGALLMTLPATIDNTFFLLYPEWALIPMVVLATLATIIASQAVITGAYSVARQAMQLGLLPRLEIRHTSESHEGQIYMPKINTLLMYSVLFLILVFNTSSSLASAYGIAVTGTFVASSVLALDYLARTRGKGYFYASALIVPLITIEIIFLSSNLLKLFEGGFVPLVFGLYFILLIVTWVKGTKYLVAKAQAQAISLLDLTQILERDTPHVIQGTAIYLTSDPHNAPETMMLNLKHNQVLHEKNIILTVVIEQVPRVPLEQRVQVEILNRFLMRVVIHFGFMETPNVPAALYRARALGYDIDVENASFFLGHRKIVADARFGLPAWQDDIYVALAKSAIDATDFFRIPPIQVVEIGTRQVI